MIRYSRATLGHAITRSAIRTNRNDDSIIIGAKSRILMKKREIAEHRKWSEFLVQWTNFSESILAQTPRLHKSSVLTKKSAISWNFYMYHFWPKIEAPSFRKIQVENFLVILTEQVKITLFLLITFRVSNVVDVFAHGLLLSHKTCQIRTFRKRVNH